MKQHRLISEQEVVHMEYVEVELEIVRFEVEDIVTSSCDSEMPDSCIADN